MGFSTLYFSDTLRLIAGLRYSEDEMRQRATAYYEHVKRRHSVRDFSTEAVPRDIIEKCLMAAGTAPNGANHQPWHFAAIGNAELKKEVRENVIRLRNHACIALWCGNNEIDVAWSHNTEGGWGWKEDYTADLGTQRTA